MEHVKEKPKKTKKDIKPKDLILVFSSFSLVCVVLIFAFIINDVFTIEDFLSFAKPLNMVITTVISLIGLILLGVILTLCIPSKYIDDTNKGFGNFPSLAIISFLFMGALFEELLFRGIIQNFLYLYLENQWVAIIIATLLFVSFHIRYFKKPIMLINITVPGLTFGWIYFETNNLLVPLLVHFLTNLTITLLLKYNLIRLKK